MKRLLFLLAFLALPAAAQDAARGKLLYENHCGGCHYERVHDRAPGKSSVNSLAELRDEVARRAPQTGQALTLQDQADIVEYLNRSHYRLAR
jgi:mono/diheme cytochrome c family protein